MNVVDKRKAVVSYLLDRNILLDTDRAEKLQNDEFVERFYDVTHGENTQVLLPPEFVEFLENKPKEPKPIAGKPYDDSPIKNERGINCFNWPDIPNQLAYEPQLEVLWTYEEPPKKRSVQDFVQYFNSRYKAIEKMLRQREELSGLLSISRIKDKKARESVALVGMVMDKQTTKNNNLIITIEDPTGKLRVIVTQRNQNLFEMARDLVLDEVVGITGMLGEGGVVFGNGIILPDIPLQTELKKSPTPGYAVFISDLQIGSKEFLEAPLLKFLHWIRGELGSEDQRKVARQVGYLLIGGDNVDGIGIHPKQEEFLSINDIYKQMEQFAEYLKLVPKYIKIIVIPGNHDPCRLAEPQPPLVSDVAKSCAELTNLTMVSNPTYVRIHSLNNFPGFEVLMYHGMSFDYYAANIDSIRQNGGYERADLIMKFLLQRRHLAPAHTSTLYLPDPKMDPLVIHRIPDFFLTGHIHYSAVAQYRSVTMINGSCWQGMSAFQEKLGHKPVWARANVINLQTRKVKVINFDS